MIVSPVIRMSVTMNDWDPVLIFIKNRKMNKITFRMGVMNNYRFTRQYCNSARCGGNGCVREERIEVFKSRKRMKMKIVWIKMSFTKQHYSRTIKFNNGTDAIDFTRCRKWVGVLWVFKTRNIPNTNREFVN